MFDSFAEMLLTLVAFLVLAYAEITEALVGLTDADEKVSAWRAHQFREFSFFESCANLGLHIKIATQTHEPS